MNSLYDYLVENYEPNEPIFLNRVTIPVSDNNLRQMFKYLTDRGKIRRFANGVYYIPKETRLKGCVTPSTDEVIRMKYIGQEDSIVGYYSGYTFANMMGLTTQVPYVMEITTNNASSRARKVEMNGLKFVIRQPKATVNDRNFRILQFLDLLTDVERLTDSEGVNAPERLAKYIYDEKFSRRDLDEYLGLYPVKIYKSIYDMRLYETFA